MMTLRLDDHIPSGMMPKTGTVDPDAPSARESKFVSHVYRLLYLQRLDGERHRLSAEEHARSRWRTIAIVAVCAFISLLSINLLWGPAGLPIETHLMIAAGGTLLLTAATLGIVISLGKKRDQAIRAAPMAATTGAETTPIHSEAS